ncbi:MAG: hypothetical protein AB7O59_12515 [Pirellulales bacterium]
MSAPLDNRRYRQFQVRHLAGLTAAAAVLFAVVAPYFREMNAERQLTTAAQAGVLLLAVIGILAYTLNRRRAAERQAGALIERFERFTSRVLFWLLASGMWIAYVATVWFHFADPARNPSFALVPGSPMLLIIAVNFIVVRGVWNIDPMGIEACQNGLLLGGFQLRRWDEIGRYSWSGDPPGQLNLFLKERFVLNMKMDAAFVSRLNAILAEHVPQ